MVESVQGLSRRNFLRLAGGAAVVAGAGTWAQPAYAQAAQGGRRIPPAKLGVQLFTVRNLLSADTVEEVIADIAAAGYREIELFNYHGLSAEEWRDILRRHRVRAVSIHRGLGIFEDEETLRAELEAAKTIGVRYFVLPNISGGLRNVEGFHYVADVLNTAGEIAREYGIKVGYHNHAFEFDPINGTTGWEILLDNTDPRLVHIQMDIGWAFRAGADPVELFLRDPGRFETVHVKDWDGSRWVNVGQGNIDWEEIFSYTHVAGIRHYLVENDDAPGTGDPIGQIEQSADYILNDLRFRPAPASAARRP